MSVSLFIKYDFLFLLHRTQQPLHSDATRCWISILLLTCFSLTGFSWEFTALPILADWNFSKVSLSNSRLVFLGCSTRGREREDILILIFEGQWMGQTVAMKKNKLTLIYSSVSNLRKKKKTTKEVYLYSTLSCVTKRSWQSTYLF